MYAFLFNEVAKIIKNHHIQKNIHLMTWSL
jgi:hypothetical protein